VLAEVGRARCVAGFGAAPALPDFGYWYARRWRDAEQQRTFEQVEVRPPGAGVAVFAWRPGILFRVSLIT